MTQLESSSSVWSPSVWSSSVGFRGSVIGCAALALLVAGCDLIKPAAKKKSPPKEQTVVAKNDKPTEKKAETKPKKGPTDEVVKVEPFGPGRKNSVRRHDGFSAAAAAREGFGKIDTNIGSGMGGMNGMGGEDAFDKVEAEIRSAAEGRKTLVVYIADTASKLASGRLADRIGRMLKTGDAKGSAVAENLSAALVTFDSKVEVVTPEPIQDGPAFTKALQAAVGGGAEGKLAYAAVKRAAERFGEWRNKDYEVIFVLLAQDAAPDEAAFSAAVTALKRLSIPVYTFGKPERFFIKNAKPLPGKPVGAGWGVEHISLYTPARLDETQFNDSGYGDFGLERISRATGGKFYRASASNSAQGWATDATGDIRAELLRKYAPDYVSEAEYKKAAETNKARRAVLEASKLVVDAEFEPPTLTFPGGDGENQARLNNSITAAQRKAANPQGEIEKIVAALQAGEPDRAKLGSPRWEASFDLAMGRALGALARTLGYNKMLAQLKGGKAFTKPNSNMWELKASPNFSGDSQLNTMAKKSREYLKRVVDNHPGTPWAEIATKELASDCGWDWEER